MIKFFRKIRQNLLLEGKTGKYFKYAIGGIFLVVIGILIALQINNWNEWRKERIKERETLSEQVENLESNIKLIKHIQGSLESYNNSSEIIFSALENNTPYGDSLAKHFYKAFKQGGGLVSGLTQTGFEGLKNEGFHIIRKDSVRIAIIKLFENYIPNMEFELNRTHLNFPNYQIHILRAFIVDDFKLHPIEYEELLDDKFIYSILKNISQERKGISKLIEFNLYVTNKVLEIIDTELNSLEN